MAFAFQHAIGTAAAIAKLAVLLLPTGILLADAVRREDNIILWMGVAFQAGVCFLSFFARGAWRQPLGPAVITLYLIALSWLWFGDRAEDSFSHTARAVLLVVPLVFFGVQMLYDSGAPAMRQASILAGRLAYRREWPNDLEACRYLPEVKALRAALNYDATPALALLNHPRAEVRVAALASLEFRKDWRPGQAELVLQVAQRAEQAIIRTVAVAALGNLEDRKLIENLAQFLFDPSLEVRRAAVEALLWDSEHRWPWIRLPFAASSRITFVLADGPLVVAKC
ncbi:MAG: HEAT repeat domain-containing protein [Gemmataceae bacterium]